MRPFLLFTLATSLFLGSRAYADTFVVTKIADTNGNCRVSDCSLREAIKAANTLNAGNANQGADITFAPALNGTILLTSALPGIAFSDLNITVPSGNRITLDAQNQYGVFSIGRSSVVLTGFNIINGAGANSAVLCSSAILTMNNCTFSNNNSVFGGAIDNENGWLTVNNCTFLGNSANFGGAIRNSNQATITNCSFSDNTASIGGAISNGGLLTVANCTLVGNTAYDGGGIDNSSNLYMRNTIVAGNSANTRGPDINGTVGNAYYNLIQRVGGLIFLGGSGNNITGRDPQLGPLADNGGPTQTFALLSFSPALNAGDPAFDTTNTPCDQRGPGYARKKGVAIDIGAFEFQDVVPSDLALSQSTVAEKQAFGAYVGSFITTDPDSNDTFTYAFASGIGDEDNSRFFLRGGSLRAAASFDVAVKSSYSIRVKTTDSAGLSFIKQFTITVTEATPPQIFISSPTANQKILISNFTGNVVRGTASDNKRVTSVKVRLSRKRGTTNMYWDGADFVTTPTTVDAAVAGSTNATWVLRNLPPANKLDSGAYQVEAYALDAAGNKSTTAKAGFTLGTDFLAPDVSINTPSANQHLSINALGAGAITGNASDDMGVTSVKLKLQRKRGTSTTYWNGSAFTTTPSLVDATVTPTGGASVTWSLHRPIPANQLNAGAYTVYATAYDAAGNFKTTPSRGFTITGTASAPVSAARASSANGS